MRKNGSITGGPFNHFPGDPEALVRPQVFSPRGTVCSGWGVRGNPLPQIRRQGAVGVAGRSEDRIRRKPSALSLVFSGRGVRMEVVSCLGRKDR